MATRKKPRKSGRIEVRVESARASRISLAASLGGQTVSAFVLDAVSQKAEQVIGENTKTIVPPRFFDALWKSLSAPPKAPPRLAAEARKPRRFVQRG